VVPALISGNVSKETGVPAEKGQDKVGVALLGASAGADGPCHAMQGIQGKVKKHAAAQQLQNAPCDERLPVPNCRVGRPGSGLGPHIEGRGQG